MEKLLPNIYKYKLQLTYTQTYNNTQSINKMTEDLYLLVSCQSNGTWYYLLFTQMNSELLLYKKVHSKQHKHSKSAKVALKATAYANNGKVPCPIAKNRGVPFYDPSAGHGLIPRSWTRCCLLPSLDLYQITLLGDSNKCS